MGGYQLWVFGVCCPEKYDTGSQKNDIVISERSTGTPFSVAALFILRYRSHYTRHRPIECSVGFRRMFTPDNGQTFFAMSTTRGNSSDEMDAIEQFRFSETSYHLKCLLLTEKTKR